VKLLKSMTKTPIFTSSGEAAVSPGAVTFTGAASAGTVSRAARRAVTRSMQKDRFFQSVSGGASARAGIGEKCRRKMVSSS
jgi:hypothetical protein